MYDPETVAAAFQRLFRTYPSFQAADADETLRVYFEAVEPYETRDIGLAVSNFLTGSAPGHNPAFAPSAPLLGAEARRVRNLRLEREARDRLSRPALPVPHIEHSAEVRARVLKLAAETAAKLRTPDAKVATSDADYWRTTREMFAPDPTPAAMLRRLGYSVGDPEGEAA